MRGLSSSSPHRERRLARFGLGMYTTPVNFFDDGEIFYFRISSCPSTYDTGEDPPMQRSRPMPSGTTPLPRRRCKSGCTLATTLVAMTLPRECHGMIIRPRPCTTPRDAFRRHAVSGGSHQNTPTEARRIKRRSFWGNAAAIDWMHSGGSVSSGGWRARTVQLRTKTSMGAGESGAGMGFDLGSDLGARMGSFVDGK